ncbi:hypothetical protein PVK06_020421 [Gossypium arboreum]|uniref:DUF7745 domain-containing protein n=1 Tax=Gossypium arboreum TaxID=29729 RepID=A0ABR0PMM5_GOSAR|nr:hypothetical protein PVK06_020421 [Gossypium arboreum]
MARIKEKGESKCIPWGALKELIQTHPDEAKRVDIFALSLYGLMVFPKALGYIDEVTTDLFYRLSKQVTSVPAILAETFRSLNACRKASAGSHFRLIDKVICRVFFEDYSPLKDIVASSRKVDVPEENWILGLRQFVPATHRLAQSEFVYRGPDYKRKVSEISSAWNKTCRLKGRGRRINDNIPKPNVEGARLIEEYLQVMPSKLEIMKQEFERKNLELEKRIAKLEEEKMYLSLDVDVQRMEKEVQEEKARAEYWERKFQEIRSQNLALEEENKGLKTKVTELGRSLRWHRNLDPTVKLKELKRQVRERDHVIGEALTQIREVAEYVQDLAVRADALSMMYELVSDKGHEDENIEVPEPMDIDQTGPYGKRKLESDIQKDDYLRTLNKDFETVENTTRIFGNQTENIATNEVKTEYTGESSNQQPSQTIPIPHRIDDLNKRNVAQGGIYLDLTNISISDYEKTIDDWAQSMTIVVNNNGSWSKEKFLNYFVGTFQGDVLQFLRRWEESEVGKV